MSTIFATRRGFLYQDRYAIFQFLNYFQAKKISEFYVDYTYDESGRRSVDIKIVLRDDTQLIIEVKSGEDFKKDKKKKETSEVRDAFAEFADYSSRNGSVLMCFALTPELKGKITLYWSYLMNVRESPSLLSPSARTAINRLMKLINLPCFRNQQDLYNFIKRMDIVTGESDVLDNEYDPYPPIDDLIIQKIKDLSFEFKADGTEKELPCEMLYHQMLYICLKNAGTNININSLLTETILKFFTQRQMIRRSASGDYDEILDRVRKFYSEWWSLQAAAISVPETVTLLSPQSEAETVPEGVTA